MSKKLTSKGTGNKFRISLALPVAAVIIVLITRGQRTFT